MRHAPTDDIVTINQRVAAARDRLRTADLLPAEADLSARLLAQHLLGMGYGAAPDVRERTRTRRVRGPVRGARRST